MADIAPRKCENYLGLKSWKSVCKFIIVSIWLCRPINGREPSDGQSSGDTCYGKQLHLPHGDYYGRAQAVARAFVFGKKNKRQLVTKPKFPSILKSANSHRLLLAIPTPRSHFPSLFPRYLFLFHDSLHVFRNPFIRQLNKFGPFFLATLLN